MMGRRIGHSNYLDFQHVAADFLTLGVIERPWDTARFGPSGAVFSYYDVDSFDPVGWQPGYPNPAFARMTELDGAWMARIVARFTDEHVRAAVDAAELSEDLSKELTRLLNGRRDKVLRAYFAMRSPLAEPRLVQQGEDSELCSEDLGQKTRVALPSDRFYHSRAYSSTGVKIKLDKPKARGDSWVCQTLPASPGVDYLVVDLVADSRSRPDAPPLRVHLTHDGRVYQLAGAERPKIRAAFFE